MKFKLNESVKKIGEDKNVSATYSEFDLKNILSNSTTPQRIAYCPEDELWLVSDANDTYHAYMVKTANEEGLTDTEPLGEYGRFYYIPEPFISFSHLANILKHDFVEIANVEVFDDFFLGGDKDTDVNLGTDVFFNLFGNPKIDGTVEDMEDLAMQEM